MKYETFFPDGGHVGPYNSIEAAEEDAKRHLKKSRCPYVEIKERTADGVGGYGEVVKKVMRPKTLETNYGNIIVIVSGNAGAIEEGFNRKRLGRLKTLDVIESVILGHACAGINIESEEYVEGINSALDACVNYE